MFKIGDKVVFVDQYYEKWVGCELEIIPPNKDTMRDLGSRCRVTKPKKETEICFLGREINLSNLDLKILIPKTPLTYGRALEILRGQK